MSKTITKNNFLSKFLSKFERELLTAIANGIIGIATTNGLGFMIGIYTSTPTRFWNFEFAVRKSTWNNIIPYLKPASITHDNSGLKNSSEYYGWKLYEINEAGRKLFELPAVESPVRLFLETDILNRGQFNTSERLVRAVIETDFPFLPKNTFDYVHQRAFHYSQQTWNLIVQSDEIYANTSLIPLVAGQIGSDILFNRMMQKAIDVNLAGKKIIMLRPYNDIRWENLFSKLVSAAFKYNELYTLDYDRDAFVRVNIPKLVKQIKDTE